MPELQLQTISTKHATGKARVRWDELEYKEMVKEVEKLAGPRPPVPADIVAPAWSPQAVRVLNERYFAKNEQGKALETVEEMCWRVAWELARGEVKYGKSRKEVKNQAREFYKLMLSR